MVLHCFVLLHKLKMMLLEESKRENLSHSQLEFILRYLNIAIDVIVWRRI